MSADVTPPTLDQFLVASRAEFSFLADHGFREIPLPESRCTNPYSILFERGDWRLRVEGLAYGFGAGSSVVAPDGREVPFIAPKAFREAHREGFGRGQFGELRFSALCLKTFGSGFLNGDTSRFRELEQLVRLAREEDREYWLQRDMEIAIHKAGSAFREKRYSEVVSFLSPFESRLPRAQAVKLDLAKERCQ